MGYHIFYAGIVIESFDAYTDKEAKKYATGRYLAFEKCEDDAGKVICTKLGLEQV